MCKHKQGSFEDLGMDSDFRNRTSTKWIYCTSMHSAALKRCIDIWWPESLVFVPLTRAFWDLWNQKPSQQVDDSLFFYKTFFVLRPPLLRTANILVTYLGEEEKKTPVQAAVSLCNPFDLVIPNCKSQAWVPLSRPSRSRHRHLSVKDAFIMPFHDVSPTFNQSDRICHQ